MSAPTASRAPTSTLYRVCAWALLWLCSCTAAVAGQGPPSEPSTRPAYQPYRYDEDWSALRDPALQQDIWDQVKYVPLGDGDWYLSVGGETRWRYEQLRHPGFGAQPDDRSGYLLQRHLFHTDWHFGARVRAFVEMQSGLETGRLGGPRPTDEDTLDVHQAFLDVTWHKSSRGSVTTRVGRHEVAFGAGRLISAAEGLNVRRSFDGVRLIVKRGAWTWNSTAMQLVSPTRGAFDDRADPGLLVWGAGGTGPRRWPGVGNLAAYYIGVRRKAAQFDQGIGDATRHSGGVRLWGVGGRWDYDEEAILQWGRFDSNPIRAYAVMSDVGFTLTSEAGRPRVGVRVFAASGDRDPTAPTLNAFDSLFPSTAYAGKAALVGPTNLVRLDPFLSLAPDRRLRLTFDWAPSWRTSTRDGLYAINGAVLRTGQHSDTRYVGSQATVEIESPVTTHLTLWASVVLFRAGAFLHQTPPGLDTRYVAAHAAYRF